MPYPYLKTKRVGGALWVEIENPPVNFLTTEMLEEFYHLVQGLRGDDSVRVLILTGGLEDTYIMHFSIGELAQVAKEQQSSLLGKFVRFRPAGALLQGVLSANNQLMDNVPLVESLGLKGAKLLRRQASSLFLWLQMHRLYLALERMNIITIAAINGPCNGGGTELSACFDFRFMVQDQDFTIGQPEVLVGIVPGGGCTQRLPRILGKARALEWMLTGKQLTPKEARELGFVTDVFDKADFREKVQEFADVMAKRPPVAVAAIKEAVRHSEAPLSWGLSAELLASLRCFATSDAQKAMKNYMKIIEENVNVPSDDRISPEELADIMENARFVDGFEGR